MTTTTAPASQVGIGAADEPKTSAMIAATQQATGEGEGARWAMEQAREVLSRLQYAKNAKDFDESRLMGVAILDAALSTQQAVSPPEGVEEERLRYELRRLANAIRGTAISCRGGTEPDLIANTLAGLEFQALSALGKAHLSLRREEALAGAPDAIGEEKGAGE